MPKGLLSNLDFTICRPISPTVKAPSYRKNSTVIRFKFDFPYQGPSTGSPNIVQFRTVKPNRVDPIAVSIYSQFSTIEFILHSIDFSIHTNPPVPYSNT